MVALVFDLDDTLLNSKSYNNYTDISIDNNLNYLLTNIKHDKYIYTNGTHNHAIYSLHNMKLLNEFKYIFARDKLPYMKPNYKSFNLVNNLLYYNFSKDKVLFFDDMKSNLKTAKKFGWITIWISKSCNNNNTNGLPIYIDYCFTDIVKALEYFTK